MRRYYANGYGERGFLGASGRPGTHDNDHSPDCRERGAVRLTLAWEATRVGMGRCIITSAGI